MINPDETATTFFELNREAEIPRKLTVTWNVVPWHIGDGTRIRTANRDDITSGSAPLERLLNRQMLPSLRAIVLLGKKAQKASPLVSQLRPDVRIFHSPHPSPRFINRDPRNREKILHALRDVAEFIAGL